jgi:hypothetical protein
MLVSVELAGAQVALPMNVAPAPCVVAQRLDCRAASGQLESRSPGLATRGFKLSGDGRDQLQPDVDPQLRHL